MGKITHGVNHTVTRISIHIHSLWKVIIVSAFTVVRNFSQFYYMATNHNGNGNNYRHWQFNEMNGSKLQAHSSQIISTDIASLCAFRKVNRVKHKHT